MQITTQPLGDHNIKLTIKAFSPDLDPIKQKVLKKLAAKVKIDGFREGKVPLNLAEKRIEPSALQSEFLDMAINSLYTEAIVKDAIKVVSRPKVELIKFVPFSEIEFTAEVEIIGHIKVADYKKSNIKKKLEKVTDNEIDEVLDRLKQQQATYTEVKRQSKKGDKVWIDFEGVDDQGKAVNGAKGANYPLILGSNTFIPGFEDHLVGLKIKGEKSFDITFPKNYGVAALQGKKVTFKVTINKVEEPSIDELNDDFAAKVRPFKTVAELKEDIKKQLNIEKEHQANRAYEDALLKEIISKTDVKIPPSLLNEQIEALFQEFRQNLTYRGQTLSEYLKENNFTEEQFKEKELKPSAEERLKAGLILSEIALAENILVTPEELEIRLQLLKGQYQSNKDMLNELDKPEAKNEIANRLLTEKTIAKLVDLNLSNSKSSKSSK